MLIRSNTNTPLNLLESMQYIKPINSPAMVPVVENARIGANVVALEDIMKFAESNGIEDLGYALSCVCEASSVSKSTIAFSIQEENLIGYQYYSDIVRDILSENVDIYVSPLSAHLPIYEMINISIEDMVYKNNTSLFEAFVSSDFDSFFTEVTEGENVGRIQKIKDWLSNIKRNAVDKPRDWVAKQIAALNSKMRDIIHNIENADPKSKGMWTTIKEKIARAIEWLTQKLTNVIRREKDTVTARIENFRESWIPSADYQYYKAYKSKEKEINKRYENKIPDIAYGTIRKLRIKLTAILAKLKDWAEKVEEKANRDGSSIRDIGILGKLKLYLAKLIKWVSDKLINLTKPTLTAEELNRLNDLCGKQNSELNAAMEELQKNIKYSGSGLRVVDDIHFKELMDDDNF